MRRFIQHTQDGSTTIAVAGTKITFHSVYGAVQESMHVFINAALQPLLHTKQKLRVFEMGFGTGLNALLTLNTAIANNQEIYYESVEHFPLEEPLYEELNYTSFAKELNSAAHFSLMHRCDWNKDVIINKLFVLHKVFSALENYTFTQKFDVIYYDAFDPAVQPELWTQQIFEKLYLAMECNAILTTYSAKGSVRRNMKAAGFTVEKIPGPPGKKEMSRAYKT